MKKGILVLTILLISFKIIRAQEESDCHCPPNKVRSRIYKDHSPRFVDSSLFIRDLMEKIDLKSAFDKQKQDSNINSYTYDFKIDTKGKVLPSHSYNNWPMKKEIEGFINETFNNYKWEPGYKKKCKRCLIFFYLNLDIYFDEKNILVKIKMIDEPGYNKPPILDLSIPYKSLKAPLDKR